MGLSFSNVLAHFRSRCQPMLVLLCAANPNPNSQAQPQPPCTALSMATAANNQDLGSTNIFCNRIDMEYS